MRSYVYIVVQSDYLHHEDEANGTVDHVEIISCHTTLAAANEAAETWALEACGGDEDHAGYDDRVDFADDLTRECFDTTFYPSDGDPDSIRIKVVKKKLRGPMPPASASSGSKTAPQPGPQSCVISDTKHLQDQHPSGAVAKVSVDAKPHKLRGPIWREFEDEDCKEEEPVIGEPAAKRQKM
ncbi:hypothetical protein AC578_8338 [Pseudocercospora eumusae]|uniref:Uncharacterized protein n=1 Tax=Pseudocercospora eumusae TaxID=321146 RepID=A0A139HS31_9PEZI|nr:hypothetical protein AC578_8338 [Pseudocercospora eumusae]